MLLKSLRSLICCFFLLVDIHSAIAQQDFSDVSEYKRAPLFVRNSPFKLAKYLTENDSSDYQKALNIYTWLTHNIRYDVKLYEDIKPREYSIYKALRKRKGICGHYAGLLQLLCENAGVSCLKIDGYTRGASYQEGDVFVEADHTWNAFRADSIWYLVDATWGSGALTIKKQPIKSWWNKLRKRPNMTNKTRFYRKPTLEYFAADPELMLSHHLPVDMNWQLVRFPVRLEKFESLDWSGYTAELDPIWRYEVSEEEYQKTLDNYSWNSPIEYQRLQAMQSVLFNSRNTSLMASVSYLQGNSIANTSGDLEKRLNDLGQAKQWYGLAISQMKYHQKTMREVTQQRIKDVDIKLTQEMVSPIERFQRLNQKQYNTFVKQKAKLSAQFEVANKRRDQAILNQGIYPRQFNTPKPAPKLNWRVVTSHREKIEQMSQKILEVNDTLAKLEMKFQEDFAGLSKQLELLHFKLMPLDYQLDQMRKMIELHASESRILEPMQEFKENVIFVDSLQNVIWEKESDLSRYQTLLRQFYSQRLAYYSGIQQLIVSIYQLSAGEVCDDQLFNHLDSLKHDHFHELAKQEAFWADYLDLSINHSKSLEKKISLLKNRLALDLSYAEHYLNSRISGLKFKNYRSNYIANQLIVQAEKAKNLSDERIKQYKAEQRSQLIKQQKRP